MKLEKNINMMIPLGLILIVLGAIAFLFYSDFPSINSQVGPHQISSWLAVFLVFIGLLLVVYGMSSKNV